MANTTSPITINPSEMPNYGKNVRMAEVDGYLVIVVDPTKDFGLSGSGKTNVVASTGGFVRPTGELMVGLNVVKK